jgi:succinate dehydrogenase / fumarate reductase cytochrome b subunit
MQPVSKNQVARARPLSPHLSVYRLIPTMAMSIVHRITGAALYFGTLLVVWWLAAAAGPREYFDFASQILGSWIGCLVLFGYTWALFHHMLGGIRHLIWDTGRMLEKKTSTRLAQATLAGSILLTVLAWAALYATR